MWIQKKINKRIIKRAIWSNYVYQIELEEKNKLSYDNYDNWVMSSKLKSFFQEWLNEMKKEIMKKSE